MQNESNNQPDSTLIVNAGIPQPPSVNPAAADRYGKRRIKTLTDEEYFNSILTGDRTVLGKFITLIESALPEHQLKSQALITKCLPYSGKSVRVGVTGVPGVGKSTFIESLGSYLTSKGNKLAVLAIDPSSKRTKGSILGDKTRMESLAADPNAFIRPSPSAGTLGGVARKTHESVVLCEAAGYNIIFIETVGVGQSETAVYDMVDFFLLLMLAGSGDELQGIKRGIMEMADAVIVNKADGENIARAGLTAVQMQNAIRLFPTPDSGWRPVVSTCSALTNYGIKEVWDTIENYVAFAKSSGYFWQRRSGQSRQVMKNTIGESLMMQFQQSKAVQKLLPEVESGLSSNRFSAYVAANMLIEAYRSEMNKSKK